MYSDMLLKIVKIERPQFLFGVFLFFVIGSLLAVLFNASFILSKFILGYAALLPASLAVNYINDYFDVEVDRNCKRTPISGGSGILVKNPELREPSKWLGIVLIGLSLLIAGVFAFIFSSPEFFLLMAMGNFIVWSYSAPPLKLSYRGLGEISTGLTGIILPGLGYSALAGTLNLPFIIFTIPMILYQLIIIISVEIPDLESDQLGGKNTLIASRGIEFGFKFIAICGMLATLSFLIIPFTNLFPSIIDFRILAIISLVPLSLGIVGLVKEHSNWVYTTKIAIQDLISLFVTAILFIGYFIYLVK